MGELSRDLETAKNYYILIASSPRNTAPEAARGSVRASVRSRSASSSAETPNRAAVNESEEQVGSVSRMFGRAPPASWSCSFLDTE